MVDERIGTLDDAAAPWLDRGIQRPLAGRSGDRHDSDQGKALIGDHIRIAHHHARANAPLLVTNRRVQGKQNNRATFEP